MKKVMTVIFITFLTGCSLMDTGGIPLFNRWWGRNPSSVTVVKGDTLYSISRKYNVPVRDLVEVNRLYPPYNLRIGQVLRMPNARVHIVAKGDTLYNISKRYNVDVTSLSRVNNLNYPYTLAIGQRLVLPGSVGGGTTSYASSAISTTSTQSSWSSSSSSQSTYAPPPTTYRKTKFAWPVRGSVISGYGNIGKGRNNDGINIKAPLGTTIKAADKGTVAYAGNELKGFGNLILIKHDDGWITAYAHTDRIVVRKGQRVIKGEKIATVGSSGGVNTPQLHFEIRSGKKALNPLSYMEK